MPVEIPTLLNVPCTTHSIFASPFSPIYGHDRVTLVEALVGLIDIDSLFLRMELRAVAESMLPEIDAALVSLIFTLNKVSPKLGRY